MQKIPTEPEIEKELRPFQPPRAVVWLRGAAGWTQDLGRLFWGFVTLNLRKTLFRRSPGRFRCPCQNPSDSGRAWETSCDAMLAWSSPVRFQRLCPLLKQAPDGAWRCSANTADVRPFWGRAFAHLAGAGLVVYLVAALAGFIFLRSVGYPVTYTTIAWPPAWHQINQSRAQYFFQKAKQALQDNKPIPAMMALSQSYQLDPGNYQAGRLLAQLSQAGWGDNSNRVYAELMHDHPAEASQTAAAWFLGLLARGDFRAIETLAAERVAADPAAASAWLNALLFADRRTGDTEVLRKLIQSKENLPAYVRPVCTIELQIRSASPETLQKLLHEVLPANPAPYLAYYWIDRLIHSGAADAALLELNRQGSRLDSRDRIELLLETYSTLGWQTILHDQVDQLLAGGLSPALIEVLCANLIRHPDPVILEKLFAAVYRRPLAANGDLLGAYTSLFCAAGANGDWVRLQAAAAQLKSLTGSRFTALDGAEAFFRGGSPSVPVDRCLRSLPGLPIDVSYAVYGYADRHPAGATSVRFGAAK